MSRISFSESAYAPPIMVARADGRGDEPGFELGRKGPLVKVEYLYTPFTGWVRSERVRQERGN